MKGKEQELNRDLIIGWMLIVGVLFVAYLGEVIKGEREIAYCFAFMIATGVPAFLCWLKYRKNPLDHKLRYWIVAGYFVMYLFVMVSGKTILVFTYILPLLSFLILYHQPGLVAVTGVITMLINGGFVVWRMMSGQLTLQNSRDDEIRMALLALCFVGCYVGCQLYDKINRENELYVEELSAKSRQIQEMTLQTIETIANTIDAKDEYTKGHSRRVSEYSAIIAEHLGLDKDQIMKIRYIALLHDIGKIGVPDAVLNKPGKLTETEYELMKEHTVMGGKILKDIGIFPDLDLGAKYHHERYDGRGYPNGLKGEEIPYIARIIGVADAFDAMTSNRVYRKKLPKEKVLEELRKGRGTQFDPNVTDAFLEYLDGMKEWKLIGETEESTEDAGGRLLRRVIDDQNQQARRNKEIDGLTGVYNWSAGERKVMAAMQDTRGCLALVNVDNIHKINCEYGYRRGDEYVKIVSDRLRELTTDVIVARFRGDKFMCFLPEITDTARMETIFEDFWKEIEHTRETDEHLRELEVSVGITLYDRLGKELSELLLEADKALYYMGRRNRKGYCFYKPVAEKQEGNSFEWDEKQLKELCCSVMKSGEKAASNVRVILFTAKPKNEQGISVEALEDVMHIVDYVIVSALEDENAMKRYSSIQRAVIIAGEGELNQVTESVTENFYKIYDKMDVELKFDVMNVKV